MSMKVLVTNRIGLSPASALLIAAFGINFGAGAVLIGVRDSVQSKYHRPVKPRLTSVLGVGMPAPAELRYAIGKLPAIAVIYPGCTQCSLEQPDLLWGQDLVGRVVVVVPDADRDEITRLSKILPNVRVTVCSPELARAFGIEAAPKVVKVDAFGVITFIQPSYVPGAHLSEVINGN